MSIVRTRFAPSPSGHLHIGGARTALFNYLFARHLDGVFLLRVEDTDRERSTTESIDAILDSLRWLGLDWDEGPFFQSERTALHLEHTDRLLASGHAYRCTCTPVELEQKRKEAMQAGRKAMYDRHCRNRQDVSDDVPHTIRFKAPTSGQTVVDDLVKGRVVFPNEEIDDLIIVRSDGTPTYNLSVVVDDASMAITHIIRGDDHLSNTPRQLQLYQALGYPPPAFAHVPLILGLDKARLSKRHGAASVLAYRDMGYLAEALNNYLARLGWSHGDQELFSRTELIGKFSLQHVGRSAGVFNPEKLDWVNFQHLKEMSPPDIVAAIKPLIQAHGWPVPADDAWTARVVETLQERARTLNELVEGASFFFAEEITVDPVAASKHLGKANPEALEHLRQLLADLPDWSDPSIHAAFDRVLERYELKLGKLAQPVRVALTGGTVSPGIFEVVELIGKERVLGRLDRACEICRSLSQGADT